MNPQKTIFMLWATNSGGVKTIGGVIWQPLRPLLPGLRHWKLCCFPIPRIRAYVDRPGHLWCPEQATGTAPVAVKICLIKRGETLTLP